MINTKKEYLEDYPQIRCYDKDNEFQVARMLVALFSQRYEVSFRENKKALGLRSIFGI